MIDDRVIFIGEAPGPGIDPDKASPLYPFPERSAGGRLCKMTGLWRHEYLDRTVRLNIIARYPGKKWPKAEARENAIMWQRGGILRDRRVVLVGSRVRDAFFGERRMPWLVWALRNDASTVCIPHPSGRNLYYNDPEKKAAVETFLRGLFEKEDHRDE